MQFGYSNERNLNNCKQNYEKYIDNIAEGQRKLRKSTTGI